MQSLQNLLALQSMQVLLVTGLALLLGPYRVFAEGFRAFKELNTPKSKASYIASAQDL